MSGGLTLEFAITDYCNLDCPLCSHGTPLIKHKTAMTFARFKEIATLFSRYHFDMVKLSGGEPTLHPEFGLFSKNLQALFSADQYALATNGAFLRRYIGSLQYYDLVELSRYPGKNDGLFEDLQEYKEKLNLVNLSLYDRATPERSLDDVNKPNRQEYNKAYFCRYAKVLKVVQDRLAPCCVALGVALRNGLDFNQYSVEIDKDCFKNVENMWRDMRDFCNLCHAEAERRDDFSEAALSCRPKLRTARDDAIHLPGGYYFCNGYYRYSDIGKLSPETLKWGAPVFQLNSDDLLRRLEYNLYEDIPAENRPTPHIATPFFAIPLANALPHVLRIHLTFPSTKEQREIRWKLLVQSSDYSVLAETEVGTQAEVFEFSLSWHSPATMIRLQFIPGDNYDKNDLPIGLKVFSDKVSLDFFRCLAAGNVALKPM